MQGVYVMQNNAERKNNITIGIIEDSLIHMEWIKEETAEQSHFKVVSCDDLGRAGIDSVRQWKPSLVLLDFQLKDMTGLETAKRIKTYEPHTRIFMLTAHTETSIIERIINDKNIDAVAIKGSPYIEDNFISAINHVVNGGTYLDPSLLNQLRDSGSNQGLSQLTRREFEVFIQTGTGKSDLEIANDLCVEQSHIKNLKSRIAKKIRNDDVNSLLMKLSQNANPDVIYEESV